MSSIHGLPNAKVILHDFFVCYGSHEAVKLCCDWLMNIDCMVVPYDSHVSEVM